ncbi:MAG: DMT family transporter [Firmicutes bacterium]|nr:DMT family transporter [Bacillota bacterium]
MGKQLKGNAMLFLTAFIWGTAFVAQKEGMALIGPMAFGGIRTIIGGIVLIPVILIIAKSKGEKVILDKTHIIGGICCGLALGIAGSVQQIGIYYTSVAHSGFITALYVVIVPILGIFLKKKVRPVIWCCVIAAAIGLYLLCIPSTGFGSVNVGDIIMFICAICFAGHIMIIDYFSPKTNGVVLSCIQFFVGGVFCVILTPVVDPMLGFALPTVADITASWLPILYAGALSCGVAYTLQVVAQKDTDPTIAAMILCLESVFALIAGMFILGEMMSIREIVGCIIMFAAIVVANLPAKEAKNPESDIE